MNVVVLSGGVGGARFVRGVVDVAGARSVTVVGNVGDDLEVLGMRVSPDLDSILYALAGLSDETRGWGRADESWNALAVPPSSRASRGSRSATVTSGSISYGHRRSAAASRFRL